MRHAASMRVRRRRRVYMRRAVVIAGGLGVVALAVAFVIFAVNSLAAFFSDPTDAPPVVPPAQTEQTTETTEEPLTSAPTEEPTTTGPPSSAAVTEAPSTAATTQTTRPTTFEDTLTSPRMLAYDITNNKLLFSRNDRVRCSPASMTKMLTAIVLVEQCDVNEVFTVGAEIELIDKESSTAGLKIGNRLKLPAILDALMLPSGNDAAYTIAAHIGRKALGQPNAEPMTAIKKFADLMNEKALQIGAKDSRFENPDGIYGKEHYSTAWDMMLIARKALEYPLIKNCVSQYKARHIFESGEDVTFTNTNDLLNPSKNNQFYFEGATGLKTGSITDAGVCITASAIRRGREVIVVVMGAENGTNRYNDAKALLAFAYQ